jgi:hypothetical protein
MTLVDLALFLLPGAIVGAIAGSMMKDVRAMAGGGVVGAILGWMVYVMVRLSYWMN